VTTKLSALLVLTTLALTLTGCSLFPSIDTSAPALNIVGQTKKSVTPSPIENSGTKDESARRVKMIEFQAKIASDSAAAATASESGVTNEISPGASAQPRGTAAQEMNRLEIKSSQIRLSSDNKKMVIEGELLNNGTVTANLTNFKIIAVVYDKKGKILTSGSEETTIKSLEPKTTTPFQVLLDRVPGADNYRLQGGY
jgi:hypothetical protein